MKCLNCKVFDVGFLYLLWTNDVLSYIFHGCVVWRKLNATIIVNLNTQITGTPANMMMNPHLDLAMSGSCIALVGSQLPRQLLSISSGHLNGGAPKSHTVFRNNSSCPPVASMRMQNFSLKSAALWVTSGITLPRGLSNLGCAVLIGILQIL